MTFSIVATDGTSWGVAVASKFLAVGAAVPAAVAGLGAVATQADANVAYKPQGLALLDAGLTAAEALAALLADDDGRDHRQVGIVDAAGRAASHTGPACLDWAGGRVGDGYAVQGNILTGPEVVAAVERAWLAGTATTPLARRLLVALAAGDAAGGVPRIGSNSLLPTMNTAQYRTMASRKLASGPAATIRLRLPTDWRLKAR